MLTKSGYLKAALPFLMLAAGLAFAGTLPEPAAAASGFVGSWLDYALSAILVLFAISLTFAGGHFYEDVEWMLMALSAFLGIRYLYWRGAYTLNTSSPLAWAISLAVYGAELYAISQTILFYIQVFKPADPGPAPAVKPDEMPTVDVMVTIYNEPVDILRKTLVGCRALDYPARLLKVYVLDDGGREEIKALAERLGCHYLARPTHEHAKAGNVNYGLARSAGDLVLILDTDHIPVRSFLKETVGFFNDRRVGFLQTPHYFYNGDAFQRGHRLENEVVNEQDLFFFVIQPGRALTNSAFFAGSAGIFRRQALDTVGGMQTLTIAEDLHTSMVLHAKGYKSVYVPKILSAGLSAESFAGYLRQRQRWCRGGIQMTLLDNPLFKTGLTFMQRVNYVAANSYFFGGLPRVIYLAAPLSYFLLDIAPIVSTPGVLLSYFGPYYLSGVMAFIVISRGFRTPFWSDVYETGTCFALTWTAFRTILNPWFIEFKVTPKGEKFSKRRLNWVHVVPHVLMLGALLLSMELGGYHLFKNGLVFDATLLGTFWVAYNIIILIGAIIVAEERPGHDAAPRVPRHVRATVTYGDNVKVHGRTVDLSETGCALALSAHAELPDKVDVSFTSPGEVSHFHAQVIRNDKLWSGRGATALRFVDLTEEEQDALIRHIYCSPESWHQAHHTVSEVWHALVHLIFSLPRHAAKDGDRWKLHARKRKKMSCDLVSGGVIYKGMTDDIGKTHLSMTLDGEASPSGVVLVLLHHGHETPLTLSGRVVRRRRTKGKKDILSVRFLERKDHELEYLVSHHD